MKYIYRYCVDMVPFRLVWFRVPIVFMMMRMRHHVRIATLLAGALLSAQAQWLNNPDPRHVDLKGCQ